MSLPDSGSLEALSLAELRGLVGILIAEVRRLQADNANLQGKVGAQHAVITSLQTEKQALRDEVARLKSLPPRPPIRPSGMEKATEPGTGDKGKRRSKQRRGAKRDRDAVTNEIVAKAVVPARSRFKGFEDILVREPHRVRQFKLSKDPEFATKVHDIVGLYVDPPPLPPHS